MWLKYFKNKSDAKTSYWNMSKIIMRQSKATEILPK